MNHNLTIKANRKRIHIKLDSLVSYNGETYRVINLVDMNSIVAINIHTQKVDTLLIQTLSPAVEGKDVSGYEHYDDSDIGSSEWRIAEERFQIIQPLICGATKDEVIARSEEAGVHYTTIYKWLKRYRATEVTSSLIPQKRGWKKNKSRVPTMIDEIVNNVIDEYYLTPQKVSPQKVIQEVLLRCKKSNLEPPHANTVRDRISKIDDKKRLVRRGQKDIARNKFNPAPGHFPNANHPLDYVQIDHTPLDINVVDDEHRLSIGRPCLTLAVDVFSRVVTGYYLSLDAPSETAVAMCIANSILPKSDWMLARDVEADWDVFGTMKTIHVDNGSDFRSSTLRRSCGKYGINIEFRPINGTQYGGHIERLLGNFAKHVHALPGTTFSNTDKKGNYKSEAKATLTFSELETWLLIQITKVYHKEYHSGINIPPFKKWENGIFGLEGEEASGLPPMPRDPDTVLIDFLPIIDRTIQTNGVTIDKVQYYSNVIRSWIGATDDKNKPRQFVFRRDPRDISHVWFYDPEEKTYYNVPAAKKDFPVTTIWELVAAKKELKRRGLSHYDEQDILDTIQQQKDLVDEATRKTKTARRQKQNTKVHAKSIASSKYPRPRLDNMDGTVDDNIFDDIPPTDFSQIEVK